MFPRPAPAPSPATAPGMSCQSSQAGQPAQQAIQNFAASIHRHHCLWHRHRKSQRGGIASSESRRAVGVGDKQAQKPRDGTAAGGSVCDLRCRTGSGPNVVIWTGAGGGIAQYQNGWVGKVRADESLDRPVVEVMR